MKSTPMLTGVLLLAFLLLIGSAAGASSLYPSYTYNHWGDPVAAPQAYLPSATYTGQDLGVGSFRNPEDIFVSQQGNIYVLDTGNDRLICLDSEWNVTKVIETFGADDSETFDSPSGLYVTAEEHIYVADTDNRRIVEFDPDHQVVRILDEPTTDVRGVIPENFRYRPRSVAVNPLGQIFVASYDVYDGVISLGEDGEFYGFIGAPRVAPSAADLFWHRIATEEQRARMALFLPVEYNSLAIDTYGIGLIYATEAGPAYEDSVRLINPAGDDVMRRTGQHDIVGDLIDDADEEVPVSRFIDIVPRPNGGFSVLDSVRGRVFTYNEGGSLLYVFGGLGDTIGRFRRPTALAERHHVMYVLDESKVTVFHPTPYAQAIHLAIDLYNRGRYDEAAHQWAAVARRNPGFEIPYSGIGRNLLLSEEYEGAMNYFRMAYDRSGYSDAFSRYRRDRMADHFTAIMGGVALVFGFALFGNQIRLGERIGRYSAKGLARLGEESLATRTLRSLWYALHVIVHPFDGFWDMKFEKRGSPLSATILLGVVVVSYISVRQYTAFLFNPRDVTEINVFLEMASVLVPFGLWCIINWALTTLMDGKGTLKDIYMASAYALTPVPLLHLPITFLTHFLTIEEGSFYFLLLFLGVLWAVSLLVLSTMVIHEYDGLKTIGACILIVVGVAGAMFLALLFSTVVDDLVRFVLGLYTELSFRF